MGLFRRRRGTRGVSVVPSAEGQRAPYEVASEDEARRAVDESNQRATSLLERLRGPERHQHEWEYIGRGLSGWGIVRCRTCPEQDIY